MKITVTGGSGFIGSVLLDELANAGHETAIADIRHSHPVDVTDVEGLTAALAGQEAVYHLAAEHRDDVKPIQKYYDVNVGGAEILVRAAEANGIKKIIFTSTVAVYGLNVGQSCESDKPLPFNDYGRSKLQAEEILRRWADADPSRALTIVRPVATFGSGNRGNIYTLMDQIHKNRFIMIGNGKNLKSIAYVGNVAAFLAANLNNAPGVNVYNYADKPDLQTRVLVKTIREALGLKGMGPHAPYAVGMMGGRMFDCAAKLTGRKFPISAIRVEKFCADTIVNADKAHAIFNAPTSLQEGLKAMVKAEFS